MSQVRLTGDPERFAEMKPSDLEALVEALTVDQARDLRHRLYIRREELLVRRRAIDRVRATLYRHILHKKEADR